MQNSEARKRREEQTITESGDMSRARRQFIDDYAKWLNYGEQMGWVSQETCLTHDWVPLTDSEMEREEDGADDCLFVVRTQYWLAHEQ